MNKVDDLTRRNFLANLGNILIQFVIEQNKKAEADSQATKPEQSATAETLAESLQVKGESTTKKREVKNSANKITVGEPEQSKHHANPDAVDTNT